MATTGDKDGKDDKKPAFTPAGVHRPPMFGEGKSKLVHDRKLLWSWILGHLASHRRRYVLFGAFLVFGSIVMAFSPVISRTMIDFGIVPGDLDVLFMLSMVYLALMLGTAILNFIGTCQMQVIGQGIIYNIRNELIAKIQTMSMAYFDRHLSGDIMSITTNDVDQLNNLVGQQLVQILSSFISLAFNVIFMVLLNPVLALLALVAFPVYVLATRIFRKVVTGAFKDVRQKISEVTSSIQENIAGAKVVQAFGQERKAAMEFQRANHQNYLAGLKVRKIMSTFFPFIGFISSALTALVLWAGGLLSVNSIVVLGYEMTPGTLSAFNGFLAQFFMPFMTLMQFQQIIESSMAAADRLVGLVEEEADLVDPEVPAPLPGRGSIVFDHVSFGYRFNGGTTKEQAPGMTTGAAPRVPPSMPAGMMERVMAFMNALPEPYKSFLARNMGKIPPRVRQDLMPALAGLDPARAGPVIDEVLARHGFAVPGSAAAATHPELEQSFKDTGEQGPPAMASMTPPREMLVMMGKTLAKALAPGNAVAAGQAMGGEGGMGGRQGGGMHGQSPGDVLRMLASMDIPADVFNEFPGVVKEAIAEERLRAERERSTGFVLRDVSVEIPAGSTVAIVGETGAGKTTFIKLVNRFYDVNEGSVHIDDHDVRSYNKDEMRRLIGMVPQDSFLFVGTIKDNLLYGIDDPAPADEARMIEVSKFLGLHNFIEALPGGYDTILRENASNISIGQRQLVAFARALMVNPLVLVLDEATSSVDPYTESLIQDALDKARKGRTTIIIAHRLSTIKNADKIIVIDKNKKGIIEEGTHDELVARNGRYKRLLDMQRRDVDGIAPHGAG